MFVLTIKDQNGEVADSFSFDHGSYVIGRLDDCDIVLPSNSVSRQHARVFIEDDRCYIEDLDSANGVIVDGQRVARKRDLGTASQIRVGEFYLYLEYERPSDSKKQDVMSTMFIDSGSEHHKLVRINDSFAGEEFSLSETENTIGRTDDNFILLSDSSISRRHAIIHRQGDLYSIEDLGSSNGTRVNGDEVTELSELSAGDHVEFGSVEFVFAEGDASIDPQQIAQSKSGGGLSSYASIAAFTVLGLAVGGAVVFGFVYLMHEPDGADEPADPLEAEVQELLETGQDQMQTGNWESAIGTFDEARELVPGHDQAEELHQEARQQQEGARLLEEGQQLSEQGQHAEAREKFLEIPEGTRARERAETNLEYVEGTIRHNLRTEAQRLMRQGDDDDLLEARDKAAEAYQIDPDHEHVVELIDNLEQRLEDADLDYEPIAEGR